MADLFTPLDRTARQLLCIKKWKEAKGKGTLIACTGFGKTRVGTTVIKKLCDKKNDLKVIVIVPTDLLKGQWSNILDSLGLGLNCEVLVINTAIKAKRECDLLVLDECHRYNSETFSTVFQMISYKLVLGLTATFERLDGKHEIMAKYCPIIDEITTVEALANGWVAPYKEYEVLINVDDIDTYRNYNKEFIEHFSFFNYDFGLAMSMLGKDGYKARIKYRDFLYKGKDKSEQSKVLKNIMYHSTAFMRSIQNRKAFINNHIKKLELARKIIQARPTSKIITFSNNVKMAEAIKIGNVYSGRDSKKKGRMTLEEFNNANPPAVLNTIRKADEGADIKGLSVAIIIGTDSSKIKAVQRLGRTIRKEDDKQAEVFNIVINDTVECEWFKKSHQGMQFTVIDEEGLDRVLNYQEPEPYKKKITDFSFRF